jgi:hypothetical protein
MVELYWMALLRDEPFCDWGNSRTVALAIEDVRRAYALALDGDEETGKVALGADLPWDGSGLDISLRTLFRSGLPGEDVGPLVSQFLLHDVPYGTQVILQKQIPYAPALDYLTDWDGWLRAQDTGLDHRGNGYGKANTLDAAYAHGNPMADAAFFERGFPLRRIRNMRDLARFVHKDALHQAYFNAALLLLAWEAEVDPGNPYRSALTRQRGFGTFGAPHLLSLVSEVASRALKVVWRQKWQVHRRLRPEAYGGMLHVQEIGVGGRKQPFGLARGVFPGELLLRIRAHNAAQNAVHGRAPGETLLLPMAFSSGCPIHPSYGAGHATVAGACVTILKAWFDEDQKMVDLLARRPRHPVFRGDDAHAARPVKPDAAGSDILPELSAVEGANDLTVGGELNKLASNVAMGRSMGGVHWRTDNTRSLRLGEQIATIILRRQAADYREPNSPGKPDWSWSYTSFDGRHRITVKRSGNVTVRDGAGHVTPETRALERWYMSPEFDPPP